MDLTRAWEIGHFLFQCTVSGAVPGETVWVLKVGGLGILNICSRLSGTRVSL